MRYTDALLDGLRMEADPVPDRIIADLAANGEIEAVNAVLRHCIREINEPPPALPDNVEQYLRGTARLPDWADPARLERAADVFTRYGMMVSLILSTASLVECYSCRKGVQVLAFTYRLGQNAYRRVGETAQFVLYVMAPGGMQQGGEGIAAIQKVRLMHAAIRYLILKSGRWNTAEFGLPINQEDLVGTLMAFSTTVIQGLAKLGMPLKEQDAEDYLYGWRVIGEMMGIRPDIVPRDLKEARLLRRRILARHQAPSPQGVAMTKALLEMHRQMIPGRWLDGVIPALIRRLVGDRTADWLKVPHSRWEWVVRHEPAIGGLVDRLLNRTGVLRYVIGRTALSLMTMKAIEMAGYRRAPFTIPNRLREAWSLPPADST